MSIEFKVGFTVSSFMGNPVFLRGVKHGYTEVCAYIYKTASTLKCCYMAFSFIKLSHFILVIFLNINYTALVYSYTCTFHIKYTALVYSYTCTLYINYTALVYSYTCTLHINYTALVYSYTCTLHINYTALVYFYTCTLYINYTALVYS